MSKKTLAHALEHVIVKPPHRATVSGTDGIRPRADSASQIAAILPSYPLGPTQEAMVAAHDPLDQYGTNVQQLVIESDEPLDIPCLQAAWQAVVEKHEGLRAHVVQDSVRGARQQFADQAQLSWSVTDWPSAGPTEDAARWQQFLQADLQKAFDLSQAPLHRCHVLRLASGRMRLLWTFHHVLLDGRSVALVVEDWLTMYHFLLKRGPAPLAAPTPFHRYLEWYGQWFAAHETPAIEYWRELLRGFRQPTHPPFEPFVTKTAADALMHDVRVELSVPERARLQEFADSNGVTLNTLAQVAWALVLRAHAQSDDVVFGSVRAGRHFPVEAAGQMVGVFINTLPVRANLVTGTTVRSILTQLRARSLAVRAFEPTPHAWVRRAADMNPSLPLYQSMISYERYRWNEHLARRCGKPGWRFELLGRPALPLAVAVRDGSRMELQLRSQSRAYSAETTACLLHHLRAALLDLPAKLDSPASEVNLMEADERPRVLGNWNATDHPYPQHQCVHQLFEEQARSTPEAIAVTFGKESLTYRELNQRANHLAQHLRRLGVKPDRLVGIALERSLQMVVGMLAILKAGGAYVPIDPAFPKERIRLMLEDAQSPWILSDRSSASLLADLTAEVIRLDTLPPLASADPHLDSSTAEVAPENLAYVIFTSGSTGRPKGVEITHRSLVNVLGSMRQCPGFSSQDTLLAVTTLSFDIAGLEIFLPLITGGRVVLAAREVAMDGRSLRQLLTESRATVLQATPVTWRMLLEAGWNGSPRLKALVGGEACPPELANALAAKTHSAWNMYGPTETTIWSTVAPLPPKRAPVRIGRPIANTQVYIVNPGLQIQPVGVVGELLIGGDGLARGYRNQPERTTAKFIPDPFCIARGKRLYRTGDLARWLPDGTLECLGRVDQQVKVRGYRIEPAEIESTLARHPAIRECVVAIRAGAAGEQDLVGYVVPRAGADFTTAQLRQHLKLSLPEYMVPALWVTLESLPRTPNRKIDRDALPAPADYQPTPSVTRAHTSLEEQLSVVWQDVLGKQSVGLNENFFELGGHSLLAVRLTAKIEQLLGVHLPIAALFQAPTVELLAQMITQRRTESGLTSLVPLQPLGTRPPVYFVHGWGGDVFAFLELGSQLAPEQPVYGLQAVRDQAGQYVHRTLEEMAAHYVREIQSFQPHGPYYLGGYSLGGWVAYETARQLRQQEEEVRLLAMLDTRVSCVLPWTLFLRTRAQHLAQRFGTHFTQLCQFDGTRRRHYLTSKLQAWRRAFQRNHHRPVSQPPADQNAGAWDYVAGVAHNYVPKPSLGPLQFFASEEVTPYTLVVLRQLVGPQLTVHPIAGEHGVIIDKDHVQDFAVVFKSVLREAQALSD